MKTFKSITLSTLAAASTLVLVALSTPAQACTGCTIRLNGPVLNGLSLQGPVLNGMSLQGPVLNGPVLQGMSLQGPVLNGPVLQGPVATGVQAGKFLSVTLPGGETIQVR